MIIYLSGPISGNQDHWGKCRPGYDPGEGGDHTSACFMTKDLLALLDADAIMMLDGWESSRGARTELAVARAIGLRVLNPDLTPHRLDGPVAVGESIDGAVPRPVMDAVAELTRQHQKWGEQNHADGATASGTASCWEEVFEAFAEDDPKLLRAELVQVAAVALQWADAIDRRTMGATK